MRMTVRNKGNVLFKCTQLKHSPTRHFYEKIEFEASSGTVCIHSAALMRQARFIRGHGHKRHTRDTFQASE